MDNKLKKTRIFLKDNDGNHYRICSVSNPKDHKGEHYLKIMFPDIKGVPLLTGIHNRGTVTPGERLAGGVQEFSYHYRSGISHFKDSNDRIDSKKNRPTLITNPALHLLRYIIRSETIFKIQAASKITQNDFILPIPFNGTPRGFEFAISKVAGPWNVINDQGKDPISTYKFPLDDPNVSFHISDAIWRRPPLVKNPTLFEIFTHDDPVRVFTFKPLKG
jgi:hypothetical protein